MLERLDGEFKVVATATNDRGAVFIELDAIPSNVDVALSEGVVQEEGQRVAIITPSGIVYYASVIYDKVYSYQSEWVSFVRARSSNFLMTDLSYDSYGVFLNPDNIALLLPERVEPDSGVPFYPPSPSEIPPLHGCAANTFSTRCYQDGRLTYGVICTSDPVTGAVTCRSESY